MVRLRVWHSLASQPYRGIWGAPIDNAVGESLHSTGITAGQSAEVWLALMSSVNVNLHGQRSRHVIEVAG
ncbi:hypothetical protein ACJ73_01959 [Blastomyces percursus]|uniref:Uncharacterized protein n=1 Tax=Blastomyces percursus TaxID=1658174 RepID=A0A1J9RF84_9EURO|nr:hypothetical protein ACJ73_01959 [Blastomyces percursus]